jgi:hypothetical protein
MYNKIIENIVGVFCTIIIFSTSLSCGYAQSGDTTYSVTTYISLGYSRFISELDDNDLNKNGLSGTIRLMWEPEHLLSIGLESGYLQLYNFNSKVSLGNGNTFNVSSELSAVPIMIVFSMGIFNNLKLSIGSGIFILISKVDALNNPVNSNQVSTGVLAAGSYLHPISHTISLGGEVKYYFINKIEDGDLSFQLSLQYRFLTY